MFLLLLDAQLQSCPKGISLAFQPSIPLRAKRRRGSSDRRSGLPRWVKILLKAVLLSFALLSAENLGFQLLIEAFHGEGIPTIPGVVKHRMKIMPCLASIVTVYRPAFLYARVLTRHLGMASGGAMLPGLVNGCSRA